MHSTSEKLLLIFSSLASNFLCETHKLPNKILFFKASNQTETESSFPLQESTPDPETEEIVNDEDFLDDDDFIEDAPNEVTDKYESITSGITDFEMDNYEDIESDDDEESNKTKPKIQKNRMEVVSKLLKIVESQALQGADCVPGSDLNLGEKVVSRYAQVS